MKARKVIVRLRGEQQESVFLDADYDVSDGCLFIRKDERMLGNGITNIKRTVIPLDLIWEIESESDPGR